MHPRQINQSRPLEPPRLRRGPSSSDVCAALILVLPLLLALLRLWV